MEKETYLEKKRMEHLESVINELEKLKQAVIAGEVKIYSVQKELSAYGNDPDPHLDIRVEFH